MRDLRDIILVYSTSTRAETRSHGIDFANDIIELIRDEPNPPDYRLAERLLKVTWQCAQNLMEGWMQFRNWMRKVRRLLWVFSSRVRFRSVQNVHRSLVEWRWHGGPL